MQYSLNLVKYQQDYESGQIFDVNKKNLKFDLKSSLENGEKDVVLGRSVFFLSV